MQKVLWSVVALALLVQDGGSSSRALTRAWVFFRDKQDIGLLPERDVRVTSRAMERRRKRGELGFDTLDIPVSGIYRGAIEKRGIVIRAVSRWFNGVSVEAEESALLTIEKLPFVRSVEPLRSSIRAPEEPLAERVPKKLRSGDWDYGPSAPQVSQINVPEAHRLGFTGKGVLVALLDVGFRKDHEVFREIVSENRLIAERDFVFDDEDVQRDPYDSNDYDDNHGTMTWSVLGGYAPGKIIGPGFGADFLLAKTEDARSETPIEEDYWIEAVEWAEALGADIVSSSLGYRAFDGSVDDHSFESLDGESLRISQAANIAARKGVLVVNSIGNAGPGASTISAPADALGTFAVGAVDVNGRLAFFSSRGPPADFDSMTRPRYKPDVVALGVQAFLATNDGVATYGRASGTSFSCPLVAGAAALLIEAHPDWPPEKIRTALTRTASRAAKPDHAWGYGLIDVVKAISSLPL